jgi:hypothetical protein
MTIDSMKSISNLKKSNKTKGLSNQITQTRHKQRKCDKLRIEKKEEENRLEKRTGKMTDWN